MDRYDYFQAVKDDVRDYISDNINLDEWRGDCEGLEEQLNDDLWVDDSVTGNGSGSYYCNAWKAEEALCHNLDLLGEALSDFGNDYGSALEKGAEWCDVTIRCYLLSSAISEVLDELEMDGEFEEE